MATIGQTNPHAARLRREQTDSENPLWRHLRNRNLGDYKFRRQVTIDRSSGRPIRVPPEVVAPFLEAR